MFIFDFFENHAAMDLQINQLIIHELIKEAEDTEAKLFLSQHAIPVDERAAQLLEKLNAAFLQKNDTLQGYLSTPEDALFPGYFQVLSDAAFESQAFLDFSKDTMNALQLAIQGVIGAKGGYLVYADYTHFGTRLLGLFLVRDTDGIIFQKKEGEDTFLLDAVTYLNTNKLAMACRIYVNRYQKTQGRHVELIKHAKSQKEISEYFINWIGLERPESSKALTNTFLQMVEELPLPTDEETGDPVAEGAFREQVLQFAVSSPHKTISLPAFDQRFYGEEKIAQNFMQENDIALDPEFRFDQNAIRKFYNYRLAAEGISLNFTRNDLNNQKISIEGDRVVIRSAALAEKLRAMFKGE